MDYFEIGQRIRRLRKAKGISQEQLAEKVGISTTHMSHIETANTKLSLPVFVKIAETLETQMDDLMYDTRRETVNRSWAEIEDILNQCDARKASIIADIVRYTKQSLDINL